MLPSPMKRPSPTTTKITPINRKMNREYPV